MAEIDCRCRKKRTKSKNLFRAYDRSQAPSLSGPLCPSRLCAQHKLSFLSTEMGRTQRTTQGDSRSFLSASFVLVGSSVCRVARTPIMFTSMTAHILKRGLPTFLLLALLLFGSVNPATAEVLTFDQPQLAGISGFRTFWDTPVVLAEDGPVVTTEHSPGGTGPNAVWALEQRNGGAKPGAIVFDAVHRSVLVRFPGSATHRGRTAQRLHDREG